MTDAKETLSALACAIVLCVGTAAWADQPADQNKCMNWNGYPAACSDIGTPLLCEPYPLPTSLTEDQWAAFAKQCAYHWTPRESLNSKQR